MVEATAYTLPDRKMARGKLVHHVGPRKGQDSDMSCTTVGGGETQAQTPGINDSVQKGQIHRSPPPPRSSP